MNGIININKPINFSSYDVIRKLKRLLGTKKIGHTGTLDPLATGILVVCVNKATKLSSEIESQYKVYEVSMTLGMATDTYDTEGKIVKEGSVDVDENQIKQTFKKFEGQQLQIPPMFSAIKIGGKKLYELARKDIKVDIAPRPVDIRWIEFKGFDKNKVIFSTCVSKGTYVRSLVNDIGEMLGTYATVSAINRIKVGDFIIEDSYSLEKIESMISEKDFSFLIGIEEYYSNFDSIHLTDDDYKKYINGVKLNKGLTDGKYKVYKENKFLGIGISDKKLFYSKLLI